MQESNLTIVQDWTDYDDSLVSTNGESYYKDNGIGVYSSRGQIPIPNEVSNSYPHAHSLVRLLKEFLKNYKEKTPMQILDAGCGSGVFARHFLIAAREEGILDKVQILLGDYSKAALLDIEKKQILKGFKENVDYKLLELDFFDLENTKDIKGTKFKLEELSLVVLNYIYDALPMLVLRPSIESKTTYEKLQSRLLEEKTGEVFFQETKNLNNLLVENQWQAYEPEKEAQKQYYDLLEPGKTNHLGQIFYNYGSLAVTEALGALLSKNGFIYASDMPHHEAFKTSFQVYGNTVAHFINEPLITKSMHKLNYSSLISQDALLLKMFYFKNQETVKQLDPLLKELFIDSSLTDIYADLRQCLSVILSPHSKDTNKMLLDKLLELDSHSCFSHLARASYHLRLGDNEKAKKEFTIVKELDYLGDFS